MDVQMPGLDGIAATQRIVAADAGKVVILTTFDRDDYLFESLGAGASGFLLKNTAPEDLVEAIEVVHSGHALLAPEVTRRVIKRFTGGGERVYRPDLVADLTDREREVLGLIARGLTNTEIARRCSSARPRSRPTSPESCSNWASATESKRSSSPTSAASSSPATNTERRIDGDDAERDRMLRPASFELAAEGSPACQPGDAGAPSCG